MFGHAMKMAKARLRTPADVHRGMNVGLCPVENAPELVPICDALEFEQFDGRTGDNETIELIIPYAFPIPIEGQHVLGRRVLWRVRGDLDEGHLDLKRGSPDKPGELRLSPDLVRHQIKEADPERPYILTDGNFLRHDHHAFALERRARWKIIGDFYRHLAIR